MAKYLPLNINQSKSDNMSVLGAVSGIVGAGINYLGQQSTNKANLDLAKMQNDWNEHMWNQNNLYNSPSAQVQRLIEAGINPLGQNFTSYQSSPVQSADMANQQSPQLDTGSIVQGFQGDRNLDIQEKLAEADVKLKNAQGITEAKKAGLLDSQKAEQLIKNQYADELYRYQRDNAKWQADISASDAFIRQLDSSFAGTRYYEQIRNIISSTDYNEALKLFTQVQRQWYPELTRATIKEKLSQANLNNANAKQIKEMLGITKKLTNMQIMSLYVGLYETLSKTNLNNVEAFGKALNNTYRNMGLDAFDFGVGKFQISPGKVLFGSLNCLDMVLNGRDSHNGNVMNYGGGSYSYNNPQLSDYGISKPVWQE